MSGCGRVTRNKLLYVALLQLSALPTWAAQPVPPPPSPQQEYWARFERKDWDAAITAAEQLVNAARQAPRPNPLRTAEALSLLGNAQYGKGNLVAAEAAFTEALQLIEPRVNSADSKLLDPLSGMGYTLAAQGKHQQAVPYMERALIVARRSAGLFDIRQQELLQKLASSLTTLGQAESAERHMVYLLRLVEHAYGAKDPRIVPVLCSVGDWYMELGQIAPARESYRTAVSIVEKRLGENDLAVVRPLRLLAQSYTREVFLSNYGIVSPTDKLSGATENSGGEPQPINPRYLSSDGERSLLRALQILEARPDRPQDLIETLLQTGDWFLTKQQSDKAMPYYRRAASLAKTTAIEGAPADQLVLGFPVQVYYPVPTLATRNLTRPPNETQERFVQVEFTVTPEGTVENERVVEQDATARQVSQTLEAIRAARYRPKFVQEQPVETVAVSYRQVFKQRKETE